MTDLYKALISIVVVILLLLGIHFGEGYYWQCKLQTEPQIVEIRDTISISDTIIVEKTKVLYKTVYDTIVKIQTDSDTIETTIHIPIEHKEYKDTIASDSGKFFVDLRYSGFRATIDKLDLGYSSTLTPPVVQSSKPEFRQFVGIGVGVGGGICVNPSTRVIQAEPGVFIVITYGWGYTWTSKRKITKKDYNL